MRVVCAPNSFKETLGARQVAAAMARGCHAARADVDVDMRPMADGGDGTLDVLIDAIGGVLQPLRVTGPAGGPVDAVYGRTADGVTAIVELARASGLALVAAGHRDPVHATTFGTGELMAHAVAAGARRLVCSIGGSATVDGGTGMCQAMGVRFFDAGNQVIDTPMCGAMLARIARVQVPDGLAPIVVACDVTNPLLGPEGAAAIYAPQKGATPEQVEQLQAGLAHLAAIAGRDPQEPGAGAAGGAAYGLAAFLGAELRRGFDVVAELVELERHVRTASIVLTGEGRLDGQSRFGKVVCAVAAMAARHGVPTLAIVGDTGPGADACVGPLEQGLLRSYVSLTDRYGRDRALAEPATLIAEVATELIEDA